MKKPLPLIQWQENDLPVQALWYSEGQLPPPTTVRLVDDTISANQAMALAKVGTGMLWRGDYQNARELLQAMMRRVARKPREGMQPKKQSPAEIFHAHRLEQKRKAEILGALLVPLSADYVIQLKRGQDVRSACQEVLGDIQQDIVMPLKGLLAIVSAHEWRKKKIPVMHMAKKITPHFGVFSPLRAEYLDLVMQAQLPANIELAFDIGVGSGVLSILLAQRGIAKIRATDIDPRAIECARENIHDFGFSETIEVIQANLFPQGVADLIICNPPWIPAIPSAPIEYAVFDPDSQFLKAFITQVAQHMKADGQVWLILSDIAEQLGLRTRTDLLQLFEVANLHVLSKKDTRPKHPKIRDTSDPLFFARDKEITSLWILGKKTQVDSFALVTS